MKKVSLDEYRNMVRDGVSGSRKASAIRKDHAEDEVYKQAMEALRHIQSFSSDMLHRSDVGIKMQFPRESRADVDNLSKAILDALQRVVYYDDKQVKHIIAYFSEDDIKELN